MEKTRNPVSSNIWPDSTCAISVWRKDQNLLVAGSLVFSTTEGSCFQKIRNGRLCLISREKVAGSTSFQNLFFPSSSYHLE